MFATATALFFITAITCHPGYACTSYKLAKPGYIEKVDCNAAADALIEKYGKTITDTRWICLQDIQQGNPLPVPGAPKRGLV